MTQLNSGKASVLALVATLVVSSFLLFNSVTNSFAVNCDSNGNNPACQNPTSPTPTATATATATAIANGSKVYVCKYVGTPGEDEALQTGQNPIEVSTNALPDGWSVGNFFSDQHGRSYVLALSPQDPEPTIDDCPTSTPEPTATATPTGAPETTPTATPTATTTTTNNGNDGGDTLGCATHDCSGNVAGASQGQVLGASTMAQTGGFEESLYLAIMGLGGIFSLTGVAKAFKKI